MRILHVIPYMHPDAGGPPVVVENVIRETNKLGFRSEIISTRQFCRGDETLLLQRLNRLAPTRFLEGHSRLSDLIRFGDRDLVESIRGTDVVHLHTLWSPYNVVVRRECVRCHRPYVIMPHGMLDPYSLSVHGWRKGLYLRAVERKNIALARRVIFTTDEEARLANTAIDSHPGRIIIPLGGDGDILPWRDNAHAASEFLTNYSRARARRRILFLGRLHQKKGLDRILRAMPEIAKRIPEAMLIIAGDGDDAYKRELHELISENGLESHTMLVGRLDGRLKWGAYASSELFVLPSRQENFAITVAEAMHAGVPVVVTNKVNTWPYVIEANAGTVLDDSEVDRALAERIVSLLSDTPSLSKMGQRARSYAQRNLTWVGAAKKFAECYRGVAKGYVR